MKLPLLIRTLGLALPLIACSKPPSAPTAPIQSGFERVNLPVLKVFSAQDGGAAFRAYAVSWKNQEVIVSDTLVGTDYEVGDNVGVLVMRNPFPNGEPKPGLLAFQILPKGR